jgi:hypothetical protein
MDYGTAAIEDWPLAWCEEIEDEKAEEVVRAADAEENAS